MRAYTILFAAYLTVSTLLLPNVSAQEKKISRLIISGENIKNDEAAKIITAHKNAVVRLTGQDSKLEADDVTFDEQTQVLNASGNVRITRQGDLSTGQKFVFKITSADYLVTDPHAEFVDVNGVPFSKVPMKAGNQMPPARVGGASTIPGGPVGDFDLKQPRGTTGGF